MTEKPKSKPRSQTQIKTILTDAAPVAAKLLVDAMNDDELTMKERIEIAKEILNRGYGKQALVKEETANLGEIYKIVLSDEVKKLAK
ncbi:MAG: hypothetical protein RR052_03845 [Oscillospiraceae bacterium]